MGLRRPRLLLPAKQADSLSREQLRFVFLHELAHLKCHDIAWDWGWAVLLAVHWLNPILAFARRRCRADRELRAMPWCWPGRGRQRRRLTARRFCDSHAVRPLAIEPFAPGLWELWRVEQTCNGGSP